MSGTGILVTGRSGSGILATGRSGSGATFDALVALPGQASARWWPRRARSLPSRIPCRARFRPSRANARAPISRSASNAGPGTVWRAATIGLNPTAAASANRLQPGAQSAPTSRSSRLRWVCLPAQHRAPRSDHHRGVDTGSRTSARSPGLSRAGVRSVPRPPRARLQLRNDRGPSRSSAQAGANRTNGPFVRTRPGGVDRSPGLDRHSAYFAPLSARTGPARRLTRCWAASPRLIWPRRSPSRRGAVVCRVRSRR